ncbi:MAG: hypothetical protein HGN29_09225 [Asgard group archaeon]|nr:hypothetical protein [Asgard group archaeon]
MFNISYRYVGVNIGSVSVNLVSVDDEGNYFQVKEQHLGNPMDVLDKVVKEKLNSETFYYNVSGSFGELSEIVAVERGIRSFDEKFDVILSLGGEAIVLYVLDKDGFIMNVLSHDKCAAGSGEFFIQQIERLGVSLPDAISLALKGKPIDLAYRCSVHCKSDITHKLNRGESSVEDLLASVLASMVTKVKGMMFQSRVDIKRLLVIGGLSLNDAFLKLLKEALEDVDVATKDVSPVFEAYGTALLVKDNPKLQKLELVTRKSFSTLPSLSQFSDQVTIIEPELYKKDLDRNKDYILGVDVGSTTTKAILMDPSDKSILASHYGRTSGNPVEATRECINEIISQVGKLKVNLVGVTGSGRAIVGAYLGTPAVFNEISAHSEGAVFYDKDVDTIFEIGGQDSKYMYLQNGVPVDYAMNATCSAGTGSFLEESSKGDLGVSVFDISDTAMGANEPVLFKADCAAFINTDIRTALQEGYVRDDIIGGLVYSIAENYMNKVKGSRPVGGKVFFQGGVAKNNSVGYAFAHATGKQIIIPPNPELIGAFGIALIAKTKYEQHEIDALDKETTLDKLVEEELKHLGSFTCKACANFCEIERYEVGGRKFPFGGSCTRYEHQWKRSEKIEEKENLVDVRNDLIFANEKKEIKKSEAKGKIGIPRALLTHSLYPLFSTFFYELGYEVILSDIDEDKELMTNAPFCYPIQIMHGAILDLIKKDIELVFLPHVVTLKKGEKWLNSTFCPITQASPYFAATAFKEPTFLSPVLAYDKGYAADKGLVEMAVVNLQQSRKLAKAAYDKAVAVQNKVEATFLKLGKEAIEKLKGTDETGILLVGRSYNAFPPETSLLIPKKLASMGISVIPFDFLEKTGDADIPWYFANYVKAAIDLSLENENLFLLYINSFSCTIDAFVQNYVRTELKTKPYLILELDAHTADAGVQTRLEAYLEIINNFKKSESKSEDKPFQIAKIKKRGGKVVVYTSEGKKLDIKDPRIKLNFFSFSKYHSDLSLRGFKALGFHVGESSDIILDYPVKGLRYSSGKECIPLPIVLGHMMSVYEKREPGDVIGYLALRGGSPCAVYSYYHYAEKFLETNEMKDVFLYRFDYLTQYLGIPLFDILRFGPPIILIADIMTEIESALHVVGEEGSLDLLQKYWGEFLKGFTHTKNLRKGAKRLIKQISTIPTIGSPKDYPKVLINGDFFVRFSPFFLKELREIYSKHKVLVKSADYFELALYSLHYQSHLLSHQWKKTPDQFSTILRCLATPWNRYSRVILFSKIGLQLLHLADKKERKRFEKTGLLYAKHNDLKEIFKQSKPVISPLIFGEAIPTIGTGLEALSENSFDSLILTGPMNCLPYKISQAILKPIYLENNMPFLVFDVDISAITPNMRRLIHANIEQIKRKRI